MEFKIGKTFSVTLGIGKPYKIHICAIIDEIMIVYKYYGRHKQWWHYRIEDKEMLELMINRTKLTKGEHK